ncbi:MAG TPA: hypothetical protein VJ142_01195 [Candidatus Nanoarchaeia archaeon]|nr:hypothetical protein [Candidatus Nanoarchaeia archaeon]
MGLRVLVEVMAREVPLERLPEIKQNLEFLAGQPLMKVYPDYIGKKLDYENGHRIIIVNRDYEGNRPEEVSFEYTIIDHARVEEGIFPVGSIRYTQKELEGLRQTGGKGMIVTG